MDTLWLGPKESFLAYENTNETSKQQRWMYKQNNNGGPSGGNRKYPNEYGYEADITGTI